jgi:hypothetical protein
MHGTLPPLISRSVALSVEVGLKLWERSKVPLWHLLVLLYCLRKIIFKFYAFLHLFVDILVGLAEVKRHLLRMKGVVSSAAPDKLELDYKIRTSAANVALETWIVLYYPVLSHINQ